VFSFSDCWCLFRASSRHRAVWNNLFQRVSPRYPFFDCMSHNCRFWNKRPDNVMIWPVEVLLKKKNNKTFDWGRDTISSSWQRLWWGQKATWWMKNYLQPSISAMMNRKWCRKSLVFWKTHIFFSLKKSRHCRCGRCQCWKQNDQHNLPW